MQMTVGEIRQRASVSNADDPEFHLGRVPVEMADAYSGIEPPEGFPAEAAFTEQPEPFEPGLDIGRIRQAQALAPFGGDIAEADLVELEAAFCGARDDEAVRPLWQEKKAAFVAKYPAAAVWLTPQEVARINEWNAKKERARREGRRVI